jgi:hypothetical protein
MEEALAEAVLVLTLRDSSSEVDLNPLLSRRAEGVRGQSHSVSNSDQSFPETEQAQSQVAETIPDYHPEDPPVDLSKCHIFIYRSMSLIVE